MHTTQQDIDEWTSPTRLNWIVTGSARSTQAFTISAKANDMHQGQLKTVQSNCDIKAGTIVWAANNSVMVRALLEQSLQTLDLPFEIVKTGKENWERRNSRAQAATLEAKIIYDKCTHPHC